MTLLNNFGSDSSGRIPKVGGGGQQGHVLRCSSGIIRTPILFTPILAGRENTADVACIAEKRAAAASQTQKYNYDD